MSLLAAAKKVGFPRVLAAAVLVLLGSLAMPAAAGAPVWSPYDDFSGVSLDATKWTPLEIVREIRGGKLVSTLRVDGSPGTPENNLHFINPAAIQSFQADVRLNAYTPPPGGHGRMQLAGSYYNDGTGGPGNLTGDVLAQLYILGDNILGDSTGVRIQYRVLKCLIPTCMGLNSATTLLGPTTLKSAALGEVHTLTIGWDGSVFTFTVDGTPTIVDPKPVQPIVNAAPNVPFKLLHSKLIIGGAGGEGSVTGDFDNVYVNGTLYDDFNGVPFSGPRLSPAKWADLEQVREVQGGAWVSKAAATGQPGEVTRVRSRLYFINPYAVNAIKADVTITDVQTSQDARAQARVLGGAFYNDGTSTSPTDYIGDVEAYFRILSDNGGPLTVNFLAEHCEETNCNVTTVIANDDLGTVNLGETHNLWMVWDPATHVFTYGLDSNSPRTFDPTPYYPLVKPSGQDWREIRTDVRINTDGGYGYIAATYDNVSVNSDALPVPQLAPYLQQTVTGDVAAAGVGLRGAGLGTIYLSSIPTGASVQQALLYWATIGNSGTYIAPTLNGNAVSGTLIGRAGDPSWGALQSYAYRADVTAIVQAEGGNNNYTVSGLPSNLVTGNDSEGASLIVIYSMPGATQRVVSINDGLVLLNGGRLQVYQTILGGFSAAASPTDQTTLTYVEGNSLGQYAGVGGTLVQNPNNLWNGSHWGTQTFDVSSQVSGGATSATAMLSTTGNPVLWVAAVLSVPTQTTMLSYTLTVTTAWGSVSSFPPGINNCSSTCSASFPAGQTVVLTATTGGTVFNGWSGGCSGFSPTCAVNMSADKSVGATFTPLGSQAFYSVTVIVAGSGTGSIVSTNPPGLINCTTGTCVAPPVFEGTTVTLTATPDAGSFFGGWRNCPSPPSGQTCSFTLNNSATVTATFVQQAPGLIPYDDFTNPLLDAAKWPATLEQVREIRGGRLVSTWRAVAGVGTANNAEIINPGGIQSFQADVRLNAFTPPPGGGSRIGLIASLYNESAVFRPQTGNYGPDATGDVRAQVFIEGTASDTSIGYSLFKCLDPSCYASTAVAAPVTIMPTAPGTVHTLGLAWNGSVITFSVDGQGYTANPTIAVPVGDPSPGVGLKALRTSLRPGGAGGEGYVTGDFANLYVDGSLYDDFSESRLDWGKWNTQEAVRQIQGGQLVLTTAKGGDAGFWDRSQIRFANEGAVTSMQADVAVTSYQSVNATVNARLQGVFYNDGTSTGPMDQRGDIHGVMRIQSSNGGLLQVIFNSWRCLDMACDAVTTFFNDNLGTVSPNTPYTLFLKWDGESFAYGMGSITRAFDPRPYAAVVKPPSNPEKRLRSYATVNNSGGYGYLAATFDNVYVNGEAAAPPALAPSYTVNGVQGNVVSAGVGLRGTGTGNITLSGIPTAASIQKAFLYWSTIGNTGSLLTPTLTPPGGSSTTVTGNLIGRASDPLQSTQESFAYRADVTSIVQAASGSFNGAYTIAGLPSNLAAGNDSEGASLVVIYQHTGDPSRTITINDGLVMLGGNSVGLLGYNHRLAYRTTLTGFTAPSPPGGSRLAFLVGDGQSVSSEPAPIEAAGLNTAVLGTAPFTGADGNAWDTRTYDVSAVLPAGSTTADAVLSAAYEGLLWTAAVLSVPEQPTLYTQYTLTVGKAGTGDGTVTSTPAGIDCGSTCSAGFLGGSIVTLAAATDGVTSTFLGWSGGGCSGTGPCTITMDAATTVTATFGGTAPQAYPLSVQKIGIGTGTVTSDYGGIACGNTCSGSIVAGNTVTLTAAPDAGASFTGWSETACGSNPTCPVTVTGAKSVAATFGGTAAQVYTVSVLKNGTGSGTVTSDYGGINCGSACSGTVGAGNTVTLTVTATTGTFVGWSGACTGTNPVCTFPVDQPKTATAYFSAGGLSYAVAVTKTGTGSGSVISIPAGIDCGSTCSAQFDTGMQVALVASHAPGSLFTGWSGACNGTGPCILSLAQAQNVTATFVAVPAFTSLIYEVIHSFNGSDGQFPNAGLIQGSDGNFYGTTRSGGTNNWGTVFQLTPGLPWTLTPLYSFGGSDGEIPLAALVQGSDGNFYGTAEAGGTAGEGTVFQLTPGLPWTLTTLYSFTMNGGRLPYSALVQGIDGNFYGTTEAGGTADDGTVFQLTPGPPWTPITVHSFNAIDGANIQAALVQGSDGNFYGTAELGGTAAGVGTVFQLTPGPPWTLTPLHSFSGSDDGQNPAAALVQGSDRNFYGTTQYGGTAGVGTVFQLTPGPPWTLTPLHSFNGNDGQTPAAALVQGSDGNFYGTTQYGGTAGVGTIFRITSTGTLTTIYSFAGSGGDGKQPVAALIQGSDGNFYGTTQYGGNVGFGTVFVLRLANPLTVLKTGMGGGTVSSDVGGIACGSTCNAPVAIGRTITLTATADATSTFDGWSGGGCSGTGTCTITMGDPTTVTATFGGTAAQTYPLSVQKVGSGTGTITSDYGGIACGSTCSGTIPAGNTITLYADPDTIAGAFFTSWSEASHCGSNLTCPVTVTRATTVTATFGGAAAQTYTVNVLKSGTGAGTVTSTDGGIICGSTCSGTYAAGNTVTLTATATTGTFVGWSSACTGTNPVCAFPVDQPKTATAYFSAGGSSNILSLTVPGPQTTQEGATLSFTVSAIDLDTPFLTFSVNNLPDRATFTADGTSGTFTWTPSSAQSGGNPYLIYFTVSDGTLADMKGVQITVNGTILDTDGDGVPDDVDNCPYQYNPDQFDVCNSLGNTTQAEAASNISASGSTTAPLDLTFTATFDGGSSGTNVVPVSLFNTICEVTDNATGQVVPRRIIPHGPPLNLTVGGDLLPVPAGTQYASTTTFDLRLLYPDLPEGSYTVSCTYVNFAHIPQPADWTDDTPIWKGTVSAQAQIVYSGQYAFGGFTSPTPNQPFSLGTAVPVTFSLMNTSGAVVKTALAKLFVQLLDSQGNPTGTPIPATPSGGGAGNLVPYIPAENQYHYNLATSPLASGSWQLQVQLDDGTTKIMTIVLTPKAAPVFSNLRGPTITYGTPQTSLGGTLKAGSRVPTGSVSITLNTVTQAAAINPVDGTFSSSFTTGSLTVGAYPITYAYGGDPNFTAAGPDTNQKLTVVQYSFSGFVSPIPNSTYNRGRSIPVKFSLKDVSGAFVSTCKCTLTVQKLTGKGGSPIGGPIDATPKSGSGNAFVYNAIANQYQYNLDSDRLSKGWWRLQAHLDDGTIRTDDIRIE